MSLWGLIGILRFPGDARRAPFCAPDAAFAPRERPLASAPPVCLGALWPHPCTSASEPMTAIDELIPTPRRLEVDTAYVRAPIDRVWDRVRHGELGKNRLVRALFAIRELPRRLRHEVAEPQRLSIDSFAEHDGPGFRLLVDEPQQELV